LAVGEKLKITGCYSDFDEGFTVANKIYNLVTEKGIRYSDIAIFYRTHAQSRILEEALLKRNIPYKIYGGLSFYQRKEIKDILAYLRLIINPNDEEAFKRIINYPIRGIGNTTQQKVLETAHVQHTNALAVTSDPIAYNLPVNSGTAAKLIKFGNMMQEFIAFNAEHDAYSVAEKVIMESGIMNDVSTDTLPENQSRKENIQELLSAIHEFCDMRVNNGSMDIGLVDFLSEVSLLTDQDTDQDDTTERITMMTVHAAKGLEFSYVYIVGMEEDLFPSILCKNERELEEERRLFYVAITRAKTACNISYAKSRFRNGQTQFSKPSRFLYEIDDKFIDFPEKQREDIRKERFSFLSQRQTTSARPRNLKPLAQVASTPTEEQNTYGLKIGDKITHLTFGEGTVLDITGSGDSTKALIEFKDHGNKQLLLKYAKLTIIS